MYPRLKDMRSDAKLTQKEVAAKLNMSQTGYSKYETGERIPTVENFCILANYFGTSLDFMMDRTEERTPYAPAKKP